MTRVLQEYARADKNRNGANGSTGSLKDQDLCPDLTARQRPKCPWCRRRMVVRRNKKLDVFWSCDRINCDATRPIDQRRFAAWLESRRTG